MNSRLTTRLRVGLLVLPLLAATLALPSTQALVRGADVQVSEVADFADQMSRLVRDRKIAELANLSLPSNDQIAKLAAWKSTYVTEMQKSEALRQKDYEQKVSEAKESLAAGKLDDAVDRTYRAYTLAKDQEAFTNLDWVKDLAGKVADQASKDEKAGQWLESLQLYSELNSLYEVDTRYKADMQRVRRRTQLLAVYTPKAFYEMSKVMAEKLRKERNASTTQPSTAPAEIDSDPPSFTRWQDLVENINVDMVNSAIDKAAAGWVEGTTYETLLKGGVGSLELLLTTPELATEFPGLAKEDAKAKFATALKAALAEIQPDSKITSTQMHRIIGDIMRGNDDSVKIPAEVVEMEFTDGAMEKLDPFTAVIWPHEVDEFEKSTRGTFGGVGVQISLEKGVLKVISPLEDTPAFSAGIEAGDIITAVDGKTTTGISIDQAVHSIMGKPDTKVKLTIKREGRAEPIDFSITRALIRVSSVKGYKRDPQDTSKWLYMIDPDNKIGYVRITGFQEDTAAELRSAVKSMQDQGVRGIVFDLRFNPGGLLNAATEISDMFLDHGTIVSTKGIHARPTETTADKATIVPMSLPMVVLVNQYSASASEIFSGAMKDLHRGLIVGQRSFGKGSVQNVMGLGEKAAIKLTMSYYYLPDGESLHRRDGAKTWGVEPDVVVEMTPDQVGKLLEARRDADIIAARNASTAPATVPAPQNATPPKAAEPLLDTQLDTGLMILRLQTVQSGA